MQIKLMLTAGVLAAGVMLGRETVVVSVAPKPLVIEYHKKQIERVPVSSCKMLAANYGKRFHDKAMLVALKAVK